MGFLTSVPESSPIFQSFHIKWKNWLQKVTGVTILSFLHVSDTGKHYDDSLYHLKPFSQNMKWHGLLMYANINAAHRVMTSSRMKKPRCVYIFNVIFGARLCCFHLRGEKAGNWRKNWVERDLWMSDWAEDPNPSPGWAGFEVRSGCQGCVLWFQVSPGTKILPTRLSLPFAAFDHPHCEGFSSVQPNKFLRISLSASCVRCLSALCCALPRSLWLHLPCNHPQVVEYSSYIFPSLLQGGWTNTDFSFLLQHC